MAGAAIVFQVRVLVEDHQARLAFQIPHEARNGEFRGYPREHVDAIGHGVRLDDFDAFVLAKPRMYFPMSERSLAYIDFLRYFGVKTMWYLQSHLLWERLDTSSFFRGIM